MQDPIARLGVIRLALGSSLVLLPSPVRTHDRDPSLRTAVKGSALPRHEALERHSQSDEPSDH